MNTSLLITATHGGQVQAWNTQNSVWESQVIFEKDSNCSFNTLLIFNKGENLAIGSSDGLRILSFNLNY